MRQTGYVVSADQSVAIVRFIRTDACGKCNACFRFGKSEADVEIKNTLSAKAGDRVLIEMHEGSVLKASLILYGVPLVALVAGAAIGNQYGDLYAAVGGVLFAAGSFFLIRAFEPRFSRMKTFKPRMISIVDDLEKGNGSDGNDSEQCD